MSLKDFFYKSLWGCIFKIPSLFAGYVLAVCCIFCIGCLDVPNSPDTSKKIESLNVYVKQNNKIIEGKLQINSMDSALLVAEVSPDFYKDKIRYLWFKDNEILDSGITYKILSSFMLSDFIEELFIPNRLVIFDSENNQIECKFEIQLNVPPQISKQTTPADGDTLFGDFYTPFLFKWNSYDLDKNDKIQNILQIDETFYHLGNLNQIMQSGFTPGKHTFRVIVKDNIGIMDSLDFREFFVVDTLEGK